LEAINCLDSDNSNAFVCMLAQRGSLGPSSTLSPRTSTAGSQDAGTSRGRAISLVGASQSPDGEGAKRPSRSNSTLPVQSEPVPLPTLNSTAPLRLQLQTQSASSTDIPVEESVEEDRRGNLREGVVLAALKQADPGSQSMEGSTGKKEPKELRRARRSAKKALLEVYLHQQDQWLPPILRWTGYTKNNARQGMIEHGSGLHISHRK
jgi:hypothetical protein